ncbi:MAG: S9 family peptidase, partial [Kangiellaceae bacterium]|nr:S9 family peptidase [Kangiellaceae bacterium]
KSKDGAHIIRFGMSTETFTKGKLTVKGAKKSSLYLNSEKISGNGSYDLKLLNGDYRVLLVVEQVEAWDKLELDWKSDNESHVVSFNTDESSNRATPKQFFDSEVVSSIKLSPDGNVVVWSKTNYSNDSGDKRQSFTELYDLKKRQTLYRWQGMSPSSLSWNEKGDKVAYLHNSNLYILERSDLSISNIAKGLKGVRSISWYDRDSIVLSWHKPEKSKQKITKHYRGLEDRWSYWRGNSQLHLIDIESGFIRQLTENKLSSSLYDSDRKRGKVLFSRSPIDYKDPAHVITHVFELDVKSGEETAVGEFRTFNSAAYHPNGIVFTAGPDLLLSQGEGKGSILTKGKYANNYDGQLYISKSDGTIEALSKNFRPAIGGFEVLKNGDLVVSTTDKDKRQLYRFSFRSKKFTRIKTEVEVVDRFSVSRESKPTVVYYGTSATSPQKVVSYKMGKAKHKVLIDSAKTEYPNNKFAQLKDWDYITKSGNEIDGRVYLPANFDENQKYPAIIYYYAGTSPVSRSFTGRWPFNLYTTQGYVVYVLQPSGTIGYGQEYSAKHVNAWGLETAEDIIESTQAFVKAHPFVDANRLGNMGASYGGFMTMYLATRTDIFAASISHAGISNLTSYWGHGWWGYAYSGVATKGSFPWSNSDFYIEQSPVFHADKVSNPLLLIHGDSDTNVPVGESHQMYTALQLLGKDVDLVEFLGDDHHINKRSHRLKWWNTILAYFDKHLKGEPEWWNDIYPEK